METSKHPAGYGLGFFLAFLGGCLWGFSGACSQFLFTEKNLTSDWLVPWRLLTAGVLMVLILLVRKRRKAFAVWQHPRHARLLILFGLLGMSGCQYTYLTAIQHSNAGTATVLQYLGPALIMVYLCIRTRRKPQPLEILVLLLDLLGIFLIATHGSLHSMALSGQALFWGLLSAVFVAVYTLSPVHLLAYYDSFDVVGWGMLIGGIATMIWKHPWTTPVILDGQALLLIGCVVIFGSVFAFTLYIEGVHLIGPSKGSLVSSIEPVSAALFAVFWLGVSLTTADVLGFACILLTIVLLALRR
ncbi:MAG: DMT family transporter [Butyricicoccus sp.]|nr:DMT family transporter [Butyricicoccus sp.]